MITAVDSSVLLDVIVGDAAFADASEAALRKMSAEGALSVSECVVAEVRPALSEADFDEFFTDWGLVFAPSTRQSAALAGAMYASYLRRRDGKPKRVVADFIIAAQAQLGASRLLARDRGYYRDYFGALTLVEP